MSAILFALRPTTWETTFRLVLMSTTEGEGKPLKYPTIFNSADVAVITKMDLVAAVEFDEQATRRSIQGGASRHASVRSLSQNWVWDGRVFLDTLVRGWQDHWPHLRSDYMFTLLSIIAIGFFLGMRHATDPDHVIAITTIVSHQRSTKRAALTGALWGLGHTVTIFVVGAAIILFNLVIPVRLGLSMELSVGFMLIVLGVWNVIGFLRSMPSISQNAHGEATEIHSHPHQHGDYIHTHPHSHEPERHSHSPQQTPLARLDRSLGRIGAYQWLRPLIVGVVHGLAGSAAVALLILASIRNSSWAIAYLFLFGLGTIAGMMLITMSIASTLRLAGNRFQHFSRRLTLASGLVSLAFGLFLAYQIGFVQGLFSTHHHWTPR